MLKMGKGLNRRGNEGGKIKASKRMNKCYTYIPIPQNKYDTLETCINKKIKGEVLKEPEFWSPMILALIWVNL